MSRELSPEIIDLGFGLGYEYSPKPQLEPLVLFDVVERSELTVAALGSLGLVQDKPRVLESVERGMATLHDMLAENREPDAPAVEPYLNLTVGSKFTLGTLLAAFDKKQTSKSYIFDGLWNKYVPAELNKTSWVKNETHGSLHVNAMLLGGNYDAEPGLYYTGRNLQDQNKAVGGQSLVTPAGYIMLNAQRREAGKSLLDQTTYSRFPQLPIKTVGGVRFVGFASSFGGLLRLGGSREFAGPGVGVRLSVG